MGMLLFHQVTVLRRVHVQHEEQSVWGICSTVQGYSSDVVGLSRYVYDALQPEGQEGQDSKNATRSPTSCQGAKHSSLKCVYRP